SVDVSPLEYFPGCGLGSADTLLKHTERSGAIERECPSGWCFAEPSLQAGEIAIAIFPNCSPRSSRSNAARASANENTRSMVGRNSPAPSTRTISRYSASFPMVDRSEEHTSELQSRFDLVCRLLLEKKK